MENTAQMTTTSKSAAQSPQPEILLRDRDSDSEPFEELGNDLPFNCVVRIMHFLPMTRVFVTLSVNRNWRKAAKSEIKKCHSLRIRTTEGRGTGKKDEMVIPVEKRKQKQMLKSLAKIPAITHITILGHDEKNIFRSFLIKLMRKKAGRVRHLVTGRRLPFDGSFLYQSLTHMTMELDGGTGYEIEVPADPMTPALTHFLARGWIYTRHPFHEFLLNSSSTLESVHLQDDLPVRQDSCCYPNLTRLKCSNMSAHYLTACPSLVQLDTAIYSFNLLQVSQFKCLQKLRLAVSLSFTALDVVLTQLIEILPQINGLQELGLSFNKREVVQIKRSLIPGFDDLVQAIVSHHPDLKSLTFEGFADPTDESLNCLSKLDNFSSLTVESMIPLFTRKGVFTLLRGSSRQSIQKLDISVRDEDVRAIEREVMLMGFERKGEVDFCHRKHRHGIIARISNDSLIDETQSTSEDVDSDWSVIE